MRLNLASCFLVCAALLLPGLTQEIQAGKQPQFNAVYGQGDQVLRVAIGSPAPWAC